MRKLLLSLTCLFVMTGLAAAAEVTLVKFDKEKKEVTVKEGDAEKTYKITDRTKFVTNNADGKLVEIEYASALKGLGSPKSPGRMKFEIVTSKDEELVEARMPGKKK